MQHHGIWYTDHCKLSYPSEESPVLILKPTAVLLSIIIKPKLGISCSSLTLIDVFYFISFINKRKITYYSILICIICHFIELGINFCGFKYWPQILSKTQRRNLQTLGMAPSYGKGMDYSITFSYRYILPQMSHFRQVLASRIWYFGRREMLVIDDKLQASCPDYLINYLIFAIQFKFISI